METFKKPYEISLWEDRLVFVDYNLREYEGAVPDNISIATSYYKERKICKIGSHLLDTPIRAINPQLKRNVNGSNTLTFSIYSKYYDEELDQLLDNPYMKYLTNERKVKLKYTEKGAEKWLDFVIKNISENSETYLYTYTAQDLFVNELSKSGYNLTFDSKLNNNYGTVRELGEQVIQGTDWRIKDFETLQEIQEEALYEVVLKEQITARKIDGSMDLIIPSNKKVYTFYSNIANDHIDFPQFLYREDGQYEINSDKVIINADEYYLINIDQDFNWSKVASSLEYTSQFRGERRVRKQKALYDEVLEKNITVYEDNEGKEVYCYSKNDVITSQTVNSYITNSSDYSSTSGWKTSEIKDLSLQLFPSYSKSPSFQESRTSTLKYIQSQNGFLFNSGITDNYQTLEDLVKNDVYIFRMDCRQIDDQILETLKYASCGVKIEVKSYKYDIAGNIVSDDNQIVLFEKQVNSIKRDCQNYIWIEASCKRSLSKEQLKEKRFGIFITLSKEGTYYILNAQFFKKLEDEKGRILLPNGKAIENETVVDNIAATVKTINYFYYPEKQSKDAIEPLYVGSDIPYAPKYISNFEKVRSITAAETNRFNLLQTLSETFECWCRFEIEHKPNGEIALVKDKLKTIVYDGGASNSEYDGYIDAESGTEFIDAAYKIKELYHPLKYIIFQEKVGQKNDVGFIYGINLKLIQRTLESNNLVTKLIVKTNNNQYAKNGGCSISRAKENPINDNFLYNFNQYISQGILNSDNFYNDLYSLNTSRGWLGFYVRLKNINTNILQLNENREALSSSKAEISAQYSKYSLECESISIELRESEEEFFQKTLCEFDELPSDSAYLKDNSIIALGEKILYLRATAKQKEEEFYISEEQMTLLESKIKRIDEELAFLTKQKEAIISTFENKYSRFIQEGPWNSEDYVDDTLYYLDAESTLHKSAYPKVSYTISVIEISSLEGYENFSYSLGDITHIQDPEYFGWVKTNGVKTPYKEKIVVTETITNFDSPEKDSIKVQNYRNQFEDLFQRMAAATQKIEFYSGGYERAAGVVQADGSIASEALQEAFSNNNHTIQNANNQTVKWDEKGITTTNTKNASEIVRIISGGVFISNDGGNTWTTGITGKGINAKVITTGQLNTDAVTIYNGSQPAFKWDANGISAYRKDYQGQYDVGTYVRFNEFGIHGIKNSQSPLETIDQIWENAEFSLTWRGFKLKTSDEGGSVSIDTENDFVVEDKNHNKVIQIGRLEKENDGKSWKYGIRIKGKDNSNLEGSAAFEATYEGLKIGGWEITTEAFESPDKDADGYPEMAFYSTPKSFAQPPLPMAGDSNSQKWRLLGGRVFGLDENGILYSKGLSVQGSNISLRSERIENGEGKWQETEINTEGVEIRVYSEYDSSEQESRTSMTWLEILEKLKT